MEYLPGKEPSVYLHGNKFRKFWEDYYANHKFIPGEMVNLYIDFPYCMSNCKYCMIQPANYNTCKKEIPEYEKKLVESIEEMTDLIQLHKVGQIAFGGGTASMMSRPTVRKVVKAIGPAWDSALVRKMEVHPRDLNEDYLDFLINELHITNISIGIQSFDAESNKHQHRIMCSLSDLLKYTGILQSNGVSVNIDLVALFDGEEERNWEIFRNDVKIVRDLINPDMFFTQVNYATEARYYEYTLRLRKELIEFIKNAPEYVFADDRYYKLDINDVQAYLDTTYFMVKPDYFKYLKDNHLYKEDPRFGNYIGFGGNISHRAFSLTSDRQTIYSMYDFQHHRWIRELMPTVVPHASKSDNGELYIPTINVGQYVIPPYNEEISGPADQLLKKWGYE